MVIKGLRYVFVCFLLLSLLLLVVFFVSFFLLGGTLDKVCRFECGFQSFGGSGFSFSLPFFVISLMFLLFDVEILLVCFYPLGGSLSFYTSLICWVVLLVVLLATLYEWSQGVFS